jgi:UDP-MurNAc hydroxylase
MRLCFIANACCIYEEKGFSLLSDPWLTPGAFEGSWFHYPPIQTTPARLATVSAVYLSHLHPDHYDARTMREFPRSTPIVTVKSKVNVLERMLRDEGFTDVRSLEPEREHALGPFRLVPHAPFEKHPFHDCEIGNVIDSALLVRGEKHSVLNTNDNTPSLEAARKLRLRHGKVTVAQLNYNAAGPYPACFPRIDRETEHHRVISRNLNHLAAVSEILSPEYVMPFAGQYILGGEQWEKNRVLGTTSPEVAARTVRDYAIPLLLNEGQWIDLESGARSAPYWPIDPVEQMNYARSLSDVPYPHHADEGAQTSELSFFLFEARKNLWKHQGRWNAFPNLNLYISAPDGTAAHFNFNSKECTYGTGLARAKPFLECSMDSRLLLRILQRKAHWNNAEIGCHIDFKREPDEYLPDVHTLMSYFHA